jgi:ParB family chromosome partitioning protein
MNERRDLKIHIIPLDRITVVNPRQRGERKFKQIVDNIAKLGLKRPVTVTPSKSHNGVQEYNLVCGQGRFEAFEILGEVEIPAVIIQVSKEELLLMSLIENLARRQHSSIELVREIGSMRDRGDSFANIARKADLDIVYVRGIVKLLKQGEERLLSAVEKGQIPVSVAITIASSDDQEIQRALTEAYEANDLRGKKLLVARRLIERRRTDGKALHRGLRGRNGNAVSSKSLLKTYQEEATRQRLVIQKSKLCETRLLFVVAALKQLLRDENFITILRAEALDTLPAYLSAQIHDKGDSE